MEVSGQLHVPDAKPVRKEPLVTHWIGGWVGPWAGLDIVAKGKKNPRPCREMNPERQACSIVTVLTEQHLLRVRLWGQRVIPMSSDQIVLICLGHSRNHLSLRLCFFSLYSLFALLRANFTRHALRAHTHTFPYAALHFVIRNENLPVTRIWSIQR
jgi:hypothetical protein